MIPYHSPVRDSERAERQKKEARNERMSQVEVNNPRVVSAGSHTPQTRTQSRSEKQRQKSKYPAITSITFNAGDENPTGGGDGNKT
jgi:hypothetical protein